MLTILIALSLAIWPFTEHRNQSRDWYARRLQHIQSERARSLHWQTRQRLASHARLFR